MRTKTVNNLLILFAGICILGFFVFLIPLANVFNKPKTMEVIMPEKPKEKQEKPPELKESNAFTILLGESDKIYYYSGITNPDVKITDFDSTGIRAVLKQKKSNPDLVIIIKFSDKSRYKNVVDILDEMAISEMKRYAIVDFSKDDEELMRKADEKIKY